MATFLRLTQESLKQHLGRNPDMDYLTILPADLKGGKS